MHKNEKMSYTVIEIIVYNAGTETVDIAVLLNCPTSQNRTEDPTARSLVLQKHI